ncbi:MAG: glycoside hydrolase family 127 protein [Verrucomicrobiia bacterium]
MLRTEPNNPFSPLLPLLIFSQVVFSQQDIITNRANLALVATPSTSFVSGHETLSAVNDGFIPMHSDDKSHGAYGNWPRTGTQWVQYDWDRPISTDRIEVYWFDDSRGVRLPKECRLFYWDGNQFVPVRNGKGFGVEKNKFNITAFDEITTTKLRLEMDGQDKFSTGILEWRVIDSGKSPNVPPKVIAGDERVVVINGKTYLNGVVRDDGKPNPVPSTRWLKTEGKGRAIFENPTALSTTARFTESGVYKLTLEANDGAEKASDSLPVYVEKEPPQNSLNWVQPMRYRVISPFWKNRIKNLIVNWIPHCIEKIDDPSLPEGGIENFVQAAKKLAGEPAKHTGPVFANGWVYNTFESMCLALMVDPQSDEQIIAAQRMIKNKIEEWIPKILGSQEKDGYIHTQITISGRKRLLNKWDHEGYQAGYFLEAALAHYWMSDGKDLRMLNAAKRLADWWYNTVGPAPKMFWYDGHEEIEQALVRFGRAINEIEGKGKGDKYIELAKFMLDCRRNGEEYDQSHLPVIKQYEAVGHAVRAAYCYSAMTDIAIETRNQDYISATSSLWFNIVNRKYYITGGIGSGETSEGFGKNFSLPNGSYCESCANCGELFFQHKMNLLWKDARYADLCEETLYNAILGGLDLNGKNFTYTNPLDSSQKRYDWHGCPCCVGNLPRTLLMLPTWTYAAGNDSIYVNLFTGIETTVKTKSGIAVKLSQATDYPWDGKVTITVSPEKPQKFALYLRIPNRQTSLLYTNIPEVRGFISLSVNGKKIKPVIEDNYAVLNRRWSAGDNVEIQLPLPVQRVKCDSRVKANIGKVAIRRGPLVYNFESVDQNIDRKLKSSTQLTAEFRKELLDGVVVIKGVWDNGSPLVGIPNYARLNRGGRSIVWINDDTK